ncbi:MAG TPA: hypothetical protein VMZ29_08145 [Candidatus Bathyarchaeia archaeon]|nr:hypothetical protein [Candidatus Bathyarchaeia archaeon]
MVAAGEYMTTIAEMPNRFSSSPKRVMDSRDEFLSKIRNSQIITYTLEYFTCCFLNDPRYLKAIQLRVYHLMENKRPEITQYLISWEDVPQNEVDDWLKFQSKVDAQMQEFLSELKGYSYVMEGTL